MGHISDLVRPLAVKELTGIEVKERTSTEVQGSLEKFLAMMRSRGCSCDVCESLVAMASGALIVIEEAMKMVPTSCENGVAGLILRMHMQHMNRAMQLATGVHQKISAVEGIERATGQRPVGIPVVALNTDQADELLNAMEKDLGSDNQMVKALRQLQQLAHEKDKPNE